MIFNLIPKFHWLHIIIIYNSFYYYSHGRDFNDHGFFNFYGSLSIAMIILLVSLPFHLLIYLIKKKNKLNLFIFLISFLIFILIYFFFINNYISCEDWKNGLNNTYIKNDENKYGCQIKFPEKCPFKLGKFLLDFTKWKGIQCKTNKRNSKKNLLKYSNSIYINKNTKIFGFPLTNINPICCSKVTKNDYLTFSKYISRNLLDMNNKENIKKIPKERIPEIIIDFSKDDLGEMKINLNYNENLSKFRKKFEKKTKPYFNNVLFLYIDSLSRSNSLRQLKKTMKFIEQFMSYKGNFNSNHSSENFHSFQFFKYHSFIMHTAFNYPRIFYGEARGKNVTRITKYFKENGFITGYANDYCYRDNTRTFHKMRMIEVYDHQMTICDPNQKHYNSMVKRCLYNNINIYYLYEYGNQFWRKYKNNRKFLCIISNDGHEGTLEVVKYSDGIIFKFLNNLFNDNLLKDSIIFLISDHGVAIPSPYFFYDFYKLEANLPMLYIIVNDKKNMTYKEQYKYIYINQQSFITAYDVYNTLGHIIFGEKYISIKNKTKFHERPKSSLGISLFNKINQKKRSPKNYINMEKSICI